MAALADITVYDGAATPVSHTLSPITVLHSDKEVARCVWRENSLSLPWDAQVRVEMALAQLKSKTMRSELRVVVPTMESVSGQNAAGYTASPKVAFEDVILVVGYHSPRSTIQSRRLARMIAVNIANNVTTSVAAGTGGMYTPLCDYLIMPH